MLRKIIEEWIANSLNSQIVIKIYLFGSYITKKKYNDIDILLIYLPTNESDYSKAKKCREELSKIILQRLKQTADIILLSENEEKTNSFAKKESAKLIWERKTGLLPW